MANSNGDPTFLEILRNVIVTYKGTVGDPMSLADISKIARVEPITLISSNLTGTKELYNILHGVLNIYAAFYLQAVHILSAQLSDVRILKILDKTNPDRDLKTLLTSGYTAIEGRNNSNVQTLSLENCKFKLPMLKSDGGPKYAFESIFDEDKDAHLSSSIQKLETFEKLGSAVGKVIEVKFTVRGNDSKNSDEIAIPVVVKLDNMIIPAEVVDKILTANTDEITLGSRFKDAIAGRIGFIKDFIMCSDLVKSQKKTMIKDPTGYYNQLLKRINNSRLYSALSGNISLAGISSIVVISDEDENFIQKQVGGKLSNENTRKIIFDNTSAMMIVVVDKEWERVSIYIRDIDGFSQNSFESFKSSTQQGSGPQIQDILKAFSMGNAPSF
ncbi:MAG: hypothetical protein HGA35_03055 [Erysipelotrichaceae bacterium]|nr:hypothetical protein [Erysipelotrichaceae bacterium]